MEFPTEILKGLYRAGLSQAEVARRTGISQSTLSRWEREIPANVKAYERLLSEYHKVNRS